MVGAARLSAARDAQRAFAIICYAVRNAFALDDVSVTDTDRAGFVR